MSDQSYISPFEVKLPNTAGQQSYWGRLYGSGKALAITSAICQSDVPVVIITPDLHSCSRLCDELRFFYQQSAAKYPILTFPDWEILPYDHFSPYQDIISDRLATLVHLGQLNRGVLVIPVATLMHRVVPKDYIDAHSLQLKSAQVIDLESFRQSMTNSGYRFVSQVMEHGDMTVRGSIIDIFPMGSDQPFRIDLFDNEIDTIRIFDPESQRSSEKVTQINMLPAREVPMADQYVARFRSSWLSKFEGNPSNSQIYTDVSNHIAPAGIEYYLPMFYERTNCVLDYLGKAVLFLDEDIENAADKFFDEVETRYEQGRYDQQRPLLAPQEMFFSKQDIVERISSYPQIRVSSFSQDDSRSGSHNYATHAPVNMPVDTRAEDPLTHIKRFIASFAGRILIVAESKGRRETVRELFLRHTLPIKLFDSWHSFFVSDEKLGLTVASLDQGTVITDPEIAIISESQLFGERVQQKRLRKRRQVDTDAIVQNLTELNMGSPVVHEEHGVGRYLGLCTLTINDLPAEFIHLEYDQGDKLYVPVGSLNLISRYTGVDPEHAPLHRLGSGQWEKARRRAAEKVRDVAAELLELHARRAARKGLCYDIDNDAFSAFVQAFPFEETPGQEDAINAIIEDMGSEKPMDRLVCGDSGFGKTEVAMRAAFIAVQNNRQIAILVPTTLLAQQHFRNFKDRFADWPIRIEMLSRFINKKQQNEVIADLNAGKVDIVIGTHKLIQDDIRFKNLGLVIIDEEHRFGVRQKEKFKSLRAEVDVLTLTATPIPRTLNMALTAIRDLSIIATPPSKRLPIKSFIIEWSPHIIKEAISREINRGGQVYILHNKVEDIEQRASEIEDMVPDARVRFAHGQMPEKELEQVMTDFYHQRFNILVCTTIIETGIDVPNANTIIIERADHFGLAQLYQIRGRVGRSHHRAYAYLITPPRNAITSDAVKRLEAIESMEDLGIGFTLATHDLEIRGAGEILGDDQSGQIQEIGFGMYMELLQRAIEAMRSGKQPELDRPLDHGTEIDLHVVALIPEDYLPDVHTRLIMYKRLASARDETALTVIQEEMIDRFGLFPEQLKNLINITQLKMQASPLGVRKIDIGEQGGRVLFGEQAWVDAAKIIELIQSCPENYKLDGQDKLRVIKDLPDIDSRIKMIESLFESISISEAA